MNNPRWLPTIPDGPAWRKFFVSLGRGFAIYVGVGLLLGLLARVIIGPEAWMDFYGREDRMVWAVWWGLGWPWQTFVSIIALTSR